MHANLFVRHSAGLEGHVSEPLRFRHRGDRRRGRIPTALRARSPADAKGIEIARALSVCEPFAPSLCFLSLMLRFDLTWKICLLVLSFALCFPFAIQFISRLHVAVALMVCSCHTLYSSLVIMFCRNRARSGHVDAARANHCAGRRRGRLGCGLGLNFAGVSSACLGDWWRSRLVIHAVGTHMQPASCEACFSRPFQQFSHG